jgi:hypothetical protein
MNIYRIEGEWVGGGSNAGKQTIELVAGFTSLAYIASGNWFGMVRDYEAVHPFVLTEDGHCRYSGDRSQTRYFSIVTRPVKVGEIFELTWEDANDRHHYRITKVARLNVNAETADDTEADALADQGAAASEERQPNIFVKNSLVKYTSRPHACRASLESLLQVGNVVATGEEGVERVFTTASSFGKWFDTIRAQESE